MLNSPHGEKVFLVPSLKLTFPVPLCATAGVRAPHPGSPTRVRASCCQPPGALLAPSQHSSAPPSLLQPQMSDGPPLSCTTELMPISCWGPTAGCRIKMWSHECEWALTSSLQLIESRLLAALCCVLGRTGLRGPTGTCHQPVGLVARLGFALSLGGVSPLPCFGAFRSSLVVVPRVLALLSIFLPE